MTDKLTININELKQQLQPKPTVSVQPQKVEPDLKAISRSSNDATTKQNFIGRTGYKELFNDTKTVTIDTWYKQSFYGKVDSKGNLIVPKNNMTNVGTADSPIYMLQFAAKAFESFQALYKTRRINKSTSQHLQTIEPKKGLIDLKPFDAYINQFYDRFFNDVLANLTESRRLRTLADFYAELIGYVQFSEKPFTFPAYIESALSSEYNSGLIIDIKDFPVDVDRKKVEFFNDPNYIVYEYVAKVNGFKIDPNIPWRLHADVRSSFMQQFYATNHPNVPAVYKANFDKAADYIRSFKVFRDKLDMIYQRFIEAHPSFFFETIENNRPTLNKVIRPTFIEDRTTTEEYIKWYIDLRIVETGVDVPDASISNLLTNAKQLYWLSLKSLEGSPKRTDLRNKLSHSIEYTIGTPLFRKSSQLTAGSKGVIFLGRAIE